MMAMELLVPFHLSPLGKEKNDDSLSGTYRNILL